MDYVSQMVLMDLKAEEEGKDVGVIRKNYRDALPRLRKGEAEHASTTTFAAQQYVAEHQAWSLSWPKTAFPGVDPRVPSTLAAPNPFQNFQLESSHHQFAKEQPITRHISSQSSATSSYCAPPLQQRAQNTKTRVNRRGSRSVRPLRRIPPNAYKCHTCGEEHGGQACTSYRAIENDRMQLDPQPSSEVTHNNQILTQPEQVPKTTINPHTGRLILSYSDMCGFISLLLILKRCEAQKMASVVAEHQVHTMGPANVEFKACVSSEYGQTHRPTTASMSNGAPGLATASHYDGTHKALTTPVGFDKLEPEHPNSTSPTAISKPSFPQMSSLASSNDITPQGPPTSSSNAYEILGARSFVNPNAANMAFACYSERQRQEFDLPPSPIRKTPPPSHMVRKPAGPLNNTKILYVSTKTPSASESGCANCKRRGHDWKECEEPCGLCD